MTTTESNERVVLDVDIDAAVPCEFTSIHRINGTPVAPAEWRLFWNTKAWCSCHEPVKWTLACGACKEAILNSVGMQCLFCGYVTVLGEALDRIEPL